MSDIKFLEYIKKKDVVCWCSESPTNHGSIVQINDDNTVTMVSCQSPYYSKKYNPGMEGIEFKMSVKRTAALYS